MKDIVKYNIPIFITAKNITENTSWKDILIKSLHLADTWSEDEILSALESLCILNEIDNIEVKSANKKTYKAKIIICIDGLMKLNKLGKSIVLLKNKGNKHNSQNKNKNEYKFKFVSYLYNFKYSFYLLQMLI